MPMHVRQPEITARVAVRQTLMIETEQVQYSSLQIVNVDFILDGGEASEGTGDLSALWRFEIRGEVQNVGGAIGVAGRQASSGVVESDAVDRAGERP